MVNNLIFLVLSYTPYGLEFLLTQKIANGPSPFHLVRAICANLYFLGCFKSLRNVQCLASVRGYFFGGWGEGRIYCYSAKFLKK